MLCKEAGMNSISKQFISIEQVQNQYLNNKDVKKNVQSTDVSFEDVLRAKADNTLKFSKHALMRLDSRDINLTAEQTNRLENGVTAARNKGINESLVVIDSLAFIVNVKNNTVVTAMDKNETQNNVFTNIDGAVIM